MGEYRILPPHERQHRAFAGTPEHAHLLPPNFRKLANVGPSSEAD